MQCCILGCMYVYGIQHKAKITLNGYTYNKNLSYAETGNNEQ